MNSQQIARQLALLPLEQLNNAQVSLGLGNYETVKAKVVHNLARAVESGLITVSDIQLMQRAERPIASDPVTQVAQDVMASRSVAKLQEKIKQVEETLDAERLAIGEQLSTIEKDLREWTDRKILTLESKVSPVDNSRITEEVSRLFDQFRKTEPVEVLEEVAKALPKFQTVKARDLFPESATRYWTTEESIDFGGMPVQVWDDPLAPPVVEDYVFPPEHLHQALVALSDGLPDNCWLAGERGTGKTEFVTQLAARLKRRLFRVNFDEALERSDYIGANTIQEGNVVWKPGIITQAISYPGALVLLDEVGFARAQNLAVLHSLCERSVHRSLSVPETGERFPVASHVAFFAADNSTGHGDASGNFAGVREQNSAFLDRFSYTLRFEYLGSKQEGELIHRRTGISLDAASQIVQFANAAREKARSGLLTQPPSLRQLFAWARALKAGVPVIKSFEATILNKFPQEVHGELDGVFSAMINIKKMKEALC